MKRIYEAPVETDQPEVKDTENPDANVQEYKEWQKAVAAKETALIDMFGVLITAAKSENFDGDAVKRIINSQINKELLTAIMASNKNDELKGLAKEIDQFVKECVETTTTGILQEYFNKNLVERDRDAFNLTADPDEVDSDNDGKQREEDPEFFRFIPGKMVMDIIRGTITAFRTANVYISGGKLASWDSRGKKKDGGSGEGILKKYTKKDFKNAFNKQFPELNLDQVMPSSIDAQSVYNKAKSSDEEAIKKYYPIGVAYVAASGKSEGTEGSFTMLDDKFQEDLKKNKDLARVLSDGNVRKLQSPQKIADDQKAIYAMLGAIVAGTYKKKTDGDSSSGKKKDDGPEISSDRGSLI